MRGLYWALLLVLLAVSHSTATASRGTPQSKSWESINVTEIRNEVLERESDLLSKLDLHFQLPKHKIRTLPSWLPRQCGPSQPKDDRPWPTPREFDASVEARLLKDLYTEEEYQDILVGDAIPMAYIRMVDWLLQNGFETLGRAAFMFHSPVNVSVIAIKTVKPKQQLFNVPAAVMIYPDSIKVAPRTRRAIQLWRSLMANPGQPDALVHKNFENAMIVYFERKMPDSFWKPYLDTLLDPTQPAIGGPEVKAALQGQPVWLFCRSAYRAAYLRFLWLLNIPEFQALLVPDFDFDQEVSEFLWALLSVDARETVWEAGRTVIAPTLDLFRHGADEDASFSFEDSVVAPPDVTSVFPPILKGKTFVLRVASVSDKPVPFGRELRISYSYNMNTLEMYTDYGIILPGHEKDHIVMSIAPQHRDYKANLSDALLSQYDMELSTTISSEGTLSLPFVLAFAYAHSGSGKLVKLINAELEGSAHYVKALKDDSDLNEDGTFKVEAEKEVPVSSSGAGARMKEFEEPAVDADDEGDDGEEEEEEEDEDEEGEESGEGKKAKSKAEEEKKNSDSAHHSDEDDDKEKSTQQSSAATKKKVKSEKATSGNAAAPLDADDKEKSQQAAGSATSGQAGEAKPDDQHTGPESEKEKKEGEEADEESEEEDDEDDDEEEEDEEEEEEEDKRADRRKHSEFKKERDLVVLHYTYVAVADAIAKSLLELSKESSDVQDQAILENPPADMSHAIVRAVAYRKRIKSFMRLLVVKLMNHAAKIKADLFAPEFPDPVKGSWPLLAIEHSPSGVRLSTQVEDEQNDGEWARQVSTRRLLMERGITGAQWNLAVTHFNKLHPESIPPPPQARPIQPHSGSRMRDEL